MDNEISAVSKLNILVKVYVTECRFEIAACGSYSITALKRSFAFSSRVENYAVLYHINAGLYTELN